VVPRGSRGLETRACFDRLNNRRARSSTSGSPPVVALAETSDATMHAKSSATRSQAALIALASPS